MQSLISEPMRFRDPGQTPIFAKPIPLFLIVWSMMLVALVMHVTEYSYPDSSLGGELFLLSFVSLLAGYTMYRMLANYRGDLTPLPNEYRVNLTALRKMQKIMIGIITTLLIVNLIAYGPPPLFAVLGADTLNYVEYGKFKQVMNTALMALAVMSALETSTRRRLINYGFCFACMLAYATRGFLLVMLAQMLFSFCLTTRISRRSLYVIGAGTLLGAVLLSNFIGNSRNESTTEAFLAFFGISRTYATWPLAILWILSYISTPISNICWIVHKYPYDHPSFTFLTSSLLPAFWAPDALEVGYLGSPNVIDGVHTYLAKYFLDLWYYGIVLINVVWGGVMAWMMRNERYTRRVLTSAVLLGAISFLFFADFLTFLSIVMELSVLAWIERHAILYVTPVVE